MENLNKEKQIEEMAKDLQETHDYEGCEAWHCGGCEYEKHGKNYFCSSIKQAEKMTAKGYRKQSEGELTKAHIQAHYEAIYALADMVYQFGYSTTFRRQDSVCDGGLSSLEYAFGALLDCGCKVNSNGTITLKNLLAFQEEIRSKMKGGEQ